MGHCKYTNQNNQPCQEADLGNGYCFWHDPNVDKRGMDLAERLEEFARRGGMTQGLQLQRANLAGINLVNRNSQQGFDLSGSDLYRANLRGGSLFNLRLCSGSLMKADLRDTNLHCADLTGTNLLGVKLQGAKLDNLCIGNRLMQETLAFDAEKCGEHGSRADNLEQCEEVYRGLRKAAENQGLFKLAGGYGYKELVMRRHLLPKWSFKWLFSYLVDYLCGYGEKPENTVIFSLMLVLLSAIGYFFLGVNFEGDILKFDVDADLASNLQVFFMSLYYSVVTFTTLGYGDITPVGISRLVAALEAFIGSFTIALFVVVFVKRMTR